MSQIAAAPHEPPATRQQVRAEAVALHDAAATLARLLARSRIVGSAGMVARIASGHGSVEATLLGRLSADLQALRDDLRAVVGATTGDGTTRQLALRETGRAPGPARKVVSAALWWLQMEGGSITAAADTSPAVEFIAAVLGLVDIDGSARRHVADWMRRHPTE